MIKVRLLIALLLTTTMPLAAQESEPATAEPAAPAEAAQAPAEEAAAEESASSPPAARRETQATPQRFEPSEQVRADFDVSFPVDI
ncbi:MAG TPA: hypothetical protein VLT59_13160, partial [Steroidobacteraceae bacterium]|nr:hypothetical protein [Steroidobacteraceae bacterium]